MATFSFKKKFGDIKKPSPVPEDWYVVRIVKEPKLIPNKIKKESGENSDGAGDNIMLQLRIQSDNPEHHGRPLFVRLPMPTKEDEQSMDEFAGMPVADVKQVRIAGWTAAFNNLSIEELKDQDEVELSAGDEAFVYVETIENWIENPPEGEEFINNINIFGSSPRPVS